MCVSFDEAEFSGTKIYVGTANLEGRQVAVSAYANVATNLAPAGGANAMILPFPSRAQMGEANVVPTDGCPRFLDEMHDAWKPRTRGVAKGLLGDSHGFDDEARVFETGIYTVVLGRDAAQLADGLKRVDPAKRPPLNRAILDAYATWYPGWSLALCCFANRDSSAATPLLWWYESALDGLLFVPTLDAHDGRVPDLDAPVRMDHVVSARAGVGQGHRVRYSQVPAAVAPLLPNEVTGMSLQGLHRHGGNGDLFLSAADLERGRFSPDYRRPDQFSQGVVIR